MKQPPEPLSLPVRQPARTNTLAVRLSDEERATVERMAKYLHVPASQMARHFLLQAVAHFARIVGPGEGTAHDA